jgi:TP901 family phage tail tape measure protein
MASAGSVRAGAAFVEIFAKDGQFQRAMARVHGRLKAIGSAMQSFGTKAMLAGTAAGLPLVLAARQAAGFEDALLGMRAAAGLTADQVKVMEAEALRLSRAMGVAPEKIANAMLELAKAGMDVKDVLAGAAESAVQFARVSGVEMADAAVFMKVAMNSFGVSAVEAVDTLSAAADASETSIAAMVESFALVGSAGALFNQSLFDISQGLAVLARFGIRGEEAGTGIKTMLVRLTSPSKEAQQSLARIGLSVESFRGADGKILPLVQIVEVLEKALVGVDEQVRDQVLTDVFGDRGIRVVGAFLNVGTKGFTTMADAMESNLPVAAKFQILMSGLSGAFERLGAGVQRLSIAFAKALGDSAGSVVSGLVWMMDVLGILIQKFPLAAKVVTGVVAGMLALGIAAIALGLAFKVVAAGVSLVAAVLAVLMTPVGLIVAAFVGGIAAILVATYQLSPAFRTEVNAIMAAVGKLDFRTAWQIMNLNLAIALTQMSQLFSNAWSAIQNTAASTGSFIGDKLIEGVDRFLGLFGADILTLQGSLEKLGLYFRSAFDFSWATGELQRALGEVDARIAREREKSGGADGRAQSRADARQANADARQAANDARDAFFDGTLEGLRGDLARARDRANAKDKAPGDKTSAKRRERVEVGPGAQSPGAAAPVGFGDVLSTFAGGIASQIGIGPKTDFQPEIADNTKRAADGIEALLDKADFGKGGIQAFDPAAVQNAMAAVQQGVSAPVAGDDRDMVSAAEKTAAASERQVALLDRIERSLRGAGTLAFT